MKKISAVYKIVNEVTGDFYVGSSKDVKQRWWQHKCPSQSKRYPNNQLYQDIQKYGIENFRFQILAPVMPEYLKQVEQEFIEMLQPTYNDRWSKGWNVERWKEWFKSERYKKSSRKAANKYLNQLCEYNGETLKLSALVMRFKKAGIEHPSTEAKRHLIKK